MGAEMAINRTICMVAAKWVAYHLGRLTDISGFVFVMTAFELG
jgi:hypothetical protein